MLTGYISPTAGRLEVAGHDVVRDPLAARRTIGYVPETVPLYGHMRVGEFLRFMARLRGVAADAVEARGGRVVAPAGARRGRRASRCACCRAASASARRSRRRWCTSREIIVLDEPTNGLDPRQIIEMRALIRAPGRPAHRADELAHPQRDREDRRPRRPLARWPAARGARRWPTRADLEAWFLSVT